MSRTEDRTGTSAWPSIVALGVAALCLWLPYAAPIPLAFAVLGAMGGAWAGARLAPTRLRSSVAIIGALLAAAVAMVVGNLTAGVIVPGGGMLPESAATLRDGLLLAALSAAASALGAFLASRYSWIRPLPAGLIVVGAASLVSAHQGGAIHLPTALSDIAWMRGWHPGLLLAMVGAAAGTLAAAMMLLPRRSTRPWLQLAGIAILGLVLLSLVPELSVFHFAGDDPLGLAGRGETQDRLPQGGAAGRDDATGRRGDDLGLSGEGGGGDVPPEMVPFRDEYSREGAETPVGVALLHDDVDPLGGVFYFRQVAFSSWNGRRLVRSFQPGADADIIPRFPTLGPARGARPAGPELRARLPVTIALMHDHPHPPVLADTESIEATPVADPALFRSSYRGIASVRVGDPLDLIGHAPGARAWPERLRTLYTEAPKDPRYLEIADEAVARLHPSYADDPYAQALAIAFWLESNTQYSTRSRHASSADPTGSYLFGDRIGYCVHLAHAGAYLMRSLSLPARIAAGYAVLAEERDSGSAILLRSGDAHAWAEVYLDGVGWVPIDPAPPSLDPPLPNRDLDLQRLLGELARPESEKLEGEAGSSWRLPTWRELFIAAFCALLAYWLVGLTAKIVRRFGPFVARRDPRARLALRASMDRFAEVGLIRGRGETREEFARRAAPLSPAFERLTRVHLAATFGNRSVSIDESRDLARKVARNLGEIPRRRRFWGMLSPWRFRSVT